ncbi:MAG: hypothetical protein HQL73_00535 [Magnetococcales bacterium]|nr:hypothetical protein [Magnetococcales bacterium]
MRLFLTSLFAAVVISAFVIGIRLLWRNFFPPTKIVRDSAPVPWLQTWNGRVFLIVLVLTFASISFYRLTTVQQPPDNLERPPSREPVNKMKH